MAHISDHVTEAATHAADATLAAIGSKTTYTGAGLTVFGGLLLNELAVIVGMVVGFAGLMVQWYYKHKLTRAEIRLMEEAAQRDREEHAAKMEMYR